MALEINKVYNLDCREGLKQIDEESIDLIVTDPPYGYSFMGKDWDKAVPSVEIWKETFRVLKSGGICFVMSAPRLDVQSEVVRRLQEAGFRIDFTPIYWAYSSGFPKSMNIGKAVDKRLGCERSRSDNPNGINQNKETLKYGFSGEAISGEAKELDGSYAGFQPKPAVEVIIVAMKPLSEKTYVEQALKNGKGITWLDNCRIPFNSESDQAAAAARMHQQMRCNGEQHETVSLILNDSRIGKNPEQEYAEYMESEGRFPANLLVSDQCLDTGEIKTSRKSVIEGGFGKGINTFGDGETQVIKSSLGFDDEGDFSRYFDLDKWFQERIACSPKKTRKEIEDTFPFLVVPKPAKSEKDKGCDKIPISRNVGAYGDGIGNVPKVGGERPTGYHNVHPTVKPLKLMSYLITLGSREHDLILDPFIGSGTTAVAARNLNRNFIGIELMAEYKQIADHRIAHECCQKKLWETEEV